jgi:membrane protein YdbS with pleckstrin-like domain
MALIKCSECGREISDKAASCPSCGNPIKPNDIQPIAELKVEQKQNVIDQSSNKTEIKLGETNWLPKRIAIETLVAFFIVGLLFYWIFSGINKELATGFSWFIFVIFGLPATLIEYIKMRSISYIVNSDKITIKYGIITKSSNSINYKLITDIFIQRKILPRLFGLSYIRFITANAFYWSWLILNKDDAEWLKNFILNNRTK